MLRSNGSRLGRCSFCRLFGWVWPISPTELLCDKHLAIAEELDKKFEDQLERV